MARRGTSSSSWSRCKAGVMHRSVVAGVWTVAVGAVVCCAGAVPAGAVSSGGAPWCAGSTKTAAISAIKTAWDYVFDGAKRYSLDQRAHYIHRLDRNQRFLADYQASAKKHVIAAAITTVKINHVTCRTMTKADVDYDLVISGIVARVWHVGVWRYSTVGRGR